MDNITWITRAAGAAILVLTLLPMTTQGLLPVSIQAPLQLLQQTARWQSFEHKNCNISVRLRDAVNNETFF